MPETWTGRLIGDMHNKGITYAELAAELGVTKPYVSMILNSKRKPDGIRDRMVNAVAAIAQRKELLADKDEVKQDST